MSKANIYRILRWLFISLILGVLALSAGAVTNSAWFFHAWQAEDGLPEFTMVGLAQSPDGYLWVATHGSLSRFDGVRFQEFTPAKPTGPTTDQIRALLLDRRGRLWLARDAGTIFCVESGVITNVVRLKDSLPGAVIRAMTEDAQGGVWISDSAGNVFRIAEGKQQAFGVAEGLTGKGICWLATDARGRLWFSQSGRVGIFEDGRFVTFFTLGQQASRIALARQGGIWLCAGLKIFHYQEGGAPEEVTELKPELRGVEITVSALYEDQAHGLWIGTSSSGLFRFDSDGVKSVETSHPNIINILEDSEGNLWVGTRGGGLNRLSPQAVQLLGPASGLPFAAVQSACEDAAGSIWVAGQNGVLARRSNGAWSLISSNAGWNGGFAVCVAELDGAVLVGSRDNGVFRQQDGTFVPLAINRQLTNLFIRSLYVSTNRDLWIAVNGGVARQRRGDGSLNYFSLPPGASDVRTMVEDAGGDLWMGTTSDGLLLRVHGDTLIDETTNIMRGPQHIRCLQVTADESLWLGFVGHGLGRLKHGRLFQFHAEHGLREEYISQILPDDRGHLWIAGNRGIFQVARSELGAVAGGRTALVRSVVFGRGEGVPNLQATFGVCPGATRTRDGRLLMPMLTGLAIIDPAVLREHPAPPPVFIERMTVNGRVTAAYDIIGQLDSASNSVPVNLRALPATLRLKPGVNELVFEFTALSFSAPEAATFRYQLEGVDHDWVEADTVRVARYPHVPPGDYRFQVIACDHDGIWNESGSSLTFTVAPQLWETTWLRATVALFAVVLLGGGVLVALRRRYQRKLERLEQQQALERERTRIAQDLHDDLGAGLVEINFGSELAQDPALGTNEVREHTREIGTRAREMVTALDEIVWAVNPKHDSVSSLASYFCQFAQHFLRATPVRCHLEIASNLPAAPLNAEQRHSLFLAFKEALANLAQHAGATDLHLSITVADGMLSVVLRDNGCGFDLAVPRRRSTADGLGNMQRRLEQLGGRCELSSRPGEGTTVSFKVPLAMKPHAESHNSIEVL